MPATFLTEETEATVQAVGETDLLVGIPSYNNAGTIGHVVRAPTRPPDGGLLTLGRATDRLRHGAGAAWDRPEHRQDLEWKVPELLTLETVANRERKGRWLNLIARRPLRSAPTV